METPRCQRRCAVSPRALRMLRRHERLITASRASEPSERRVFNLVDQLCMEGRLADDVSKGVRSTLTIAGHPIHPMLVPFPIGFLVGTLASDLAYWGTGDPFWARGSMWLVGAGVVTGGLAAIFGLVDFLTIERLSVRVDSGKSNRTLKPNRRRDFLTTSGDPIPGRARFKRSTVDY